MENDKAQASNVIENFRIRGFENFSHGLSTLDKNAIHRKTLYHDTKDKLLKLIEKTERFQKIIKSFEEKEKDLNELEKTKSKVKEELEVIRKLIEEKKATRNSIKNHIKKTNSFRIGKSLESLLKIRENSNELKNQNIQGKIFGTIDQLGKINSQYSIPLRVAGGSKFNYVIVDNQITVNQCISYLKKNKLPPITFIPLDDIRVYPFKINLKHNNKVIGRAIDFIEFDPKYKKAFEFVFGRTLIVADINTALHFEVNAKRVTLEGDVIEPSNLIMGGYENRQKVLIKNEKEQKKIETIEKEISYLKKNESIYEKKIANLDNRVTSYYSGNTLSSNL